jgi:hypothetical protein
MKHYAHLQIDGNDKMLVPARRHIFHRSRRAAERALDRAARRIHQGQPTPEIRGIVTDCRTKIEIGMSL